MALTIKASSFLVQHYLKVYPWGVIFMETAALGGKRKFVFQQIDAVVMSPDSVLTFQVGNEVFSVPVKPHKPAHVAAVSALLNGLGVGHARHAFPVLR